MAMFILPAVDTLSYYEDAVTHSPESIMHAGSFQLFTLGYRKPGKSPIVIALFLYDAATNRLLMQFPDRIDHVIESDEYDMYGELNNDLATKMNDMGPDVLLAYLQDSLSHGLVISDPLTLNDSAVQ